MSLFDLVMITLVIGTFGLTVLAFGMDLDWGIHLGMSAAPLLVAAWLLVRLWTSWAIYVPQFELIMASLLIGGLALSAVAFANGDYEGVCAMVLSTLIICGWIIGRLWIWFGPQVT